MVEINSVGGSGLESMPREWTVHAQGVVQTQAEPHGAGPAAPSTGDRAPDRSLVCAQSPDSLVLSWLLHLPPSWRRDGLQTEGRSPAGEAGILGAHPEHVQWSRVGHSIALQGTLDPSCLRVDLIGEAAA